MCRLLPRCPLVAAPKTRVAPVEVEAGGPGWRRRSGDRRLGSSPRVASEGFAPTGASGGTASTSAAGVVEVQGQTSATAEAEAAVAVHSQLAFPASPTANAVIPTIPRM